MSRTASCGILTSPDSMASIRPKSLTTQGKGRFVSCPTRAEEVRRRRQVHAEVDAAQLVDAVQPVDPDGASLKNSSASSSRPEHVVLIFLGGLALDAVGVVGLVVHDQDVLFAAHFAAEDAIDQGSVAFDVAHRLDANLLQVPFACRVPPR